MEYYLSWRGTIKCLIPYGETSWTMHNVMLPIKLSLGDMRNYCKNHTAIVENWSLASWGIEVGISTSTSTLIPRTWRPTYQYQCQCSISDDQDLFDFEWCVGHQHMCGFVTKENWLYIYDADSKYWLDFIIPIHNVSFYW